MRTTLALILAISTLCLAAEQRTVTWSDLQNNIDSWAKGPVSLIMTADEKQVFEKLKTPEEKMQFIKIFWARRDPVLRTRENEFKDEFYKRLEYADKNFAEGTVPGWQTARGQVYIVFGPPSRIEQRIVEDSSRPAQLWVFDRIPSDKIPRNEALMFVYRDFKYVLLPPNPNPGDEIAAEQREIETGLRYQTIPAAVDQAFADADTRAVFDAEKNYKELLYSVKSTEKFGLAGIPFEIRTSEGKPMQVRVVIKPEQAPVFDDGNNFFAELLFREELKKGDQVVASQEKTVSYNWDQKTYGNLKDIEALLPELNAPAGEYQLSVTVLDRISNISETRTTPVTIR